MAVAAPRSRAQALALELHVQPVMDMSAERRTGSDVLTGGSVLPGFALDVAAVWEPGF